MSNPYVDIAYEVFNETLAEIKDARYAAYMGGSNDLSSYQDEKELVEHMIAKFEKKLEENY